MKKETIETDFLSEGAKILLLSCCAPCSIEVTLRLKKMAVCFTLLFYNPNIRPFEEYQKRLEENKRLCFEEGVPFIDLPWEQEAWCKLVKGFENEPERGRRCDKCFAMRLERAAKFAKENGFTHFTSVLGISRYKNFEQVTSIALNISQQENIPYISTNWRKNGGEDLRAKLAKERALYHQSYCGCSPRE